ncbi:hypothetical protein EV215_1829 [Hypnocyclicus thermotrophus]|uniref:SHOCT domain-containing protein n=1 Tax=Hypnocyclicus thermotrophus TaxID=1627895 RepID=A0AA46DXJ2_9FUSO|nr:hypothetical protein [Hypnocyclicus thermotrophus]TDT68108.1 hypothetical protein EV215_1829 [Hypnocyclicus thermotrophus]
MKKTLIFMTFLLITSFSFASGLFIKSGPAWKPIKKENNTQTETFNRNWHLELDLMGKLSETWDIGAGIEFNKRYENENGKEDLGYLPIYISTRYKLRQVNTASFPYLIGRIGLSFPIKYTDNIETVSGGGYVALGIGLELDHMIIELVSSAASIQQSELLTSNKTIKFEKVSLMFGYRFGENYYTPRALYKAPVQKQPIINTKNTPINETPEYSKDVKERLDNLKQLRIDGYITEEEYYEKRKEILSDI